MKVEKKNLKLIKPQSSTPQNLNNYNISFIDQHTGTMNTAVLLFYQSKPHDYSQLEESLAGILVDFYPLAGRYLKNDHLVDCSDQGAEFVEAEATDVVDLVDLVGEIEIEKLNDLLPDQYFRLDEAAADPLLSIQATSFPCGGLAVAVSFSHRIFDASSVATFVAAWSNACHPDKAVGVSPSFHLPSLLPSKDHKFGVSLDKFRAEEEDCVVVKRLVFTAAALTSLRSKMSRHEEGRTISGVRIACAVIAKALIRLDRAKRGRYRDFAIVQPVNMRERTIPPQHKHVCGNLFIPSITPRVAAAEVEGFGTEELVDLIGGAVRKTIADHAEMLSPDRDGRDIIIATYENLINEMWNSETNVVVFGDWSKFELYEADFGWGKPVLTATGPQRPPMITTAAMRNKEGDGIEAWLHLRQTDVPFLEQDDEIAEITGIENI